MLRSITLINQIAHAVKAEQVLIYVEQSVENDGVGVASEAWLVHTKTGCLTVSFGACYTSRFCRLRRARCGVCADGGQNPAVR